MSSSILLLGSTGMLGKDIGSLMKNTGVFFNSVSRSDVSSEEGMKHFKGDLTTRGFLDYVLNDVKPDIVINCAANVSVDGCEDEREYTRALHQGVTATIGKYIGDSARRFIHVSTDSVFDGELGHYSEIDEENPLNFYSESKLKAEKAVWSVRNGLVLRTNIYGYHTQSGQSSLGEWAISNLSKGNTIKGFTDVFFNPIYTGELAFVIVKCLMECSFSGVLNLGSNQKISKYEFLTRVAMVFGFDLNLVLQASVDDMDFKARRPKDTSLDISMFSRMLGSSYGLMRGLESFKKDYDVFTS